MKKSGRKVKTNNTRSTQHQRSASNDRRAHKRLSRRSEMIEELTKGCREDQRENKQYPECFREYILQSLPR